MTRPQPSAAPLDPRLSAKRCSRGMRGELLKNYSEFGASDSEVRDQVWGVLGEKFSTQNHSQPVKPVDVNSQVRTLLVGDYEIKASVDADGHLTLTVESEDGSDVLDVGEDVQVKEGQFAVRLTTSAIEREAAICVQKSA